MIALFSRNALLRKRGIRRSSRANAYAHGRYSSPDAVRNLRVSTASAFPGCVQDKLSSSRKFRLILLVIDLPARSDLRALALPASSGNRVCSLRVASSLSPLTLGILSSSLFDSHSLLP